MKKRDRSPQVDKPFEIPEKVVAEAINNALAHRNYLSSASIQIEFYTDRVEIFSPGALNPQITPEMLRVVHRSFPNNPLLADAMYLVRYIEQIGSGTTDMIESCRALNLREPTFNVTQNAVTITLYRETPSQKSSQETSSSQESAQESSQKVLDCLGKEPTMTTSDLSAAIGVSTRTIAKILKKLQDDNALKRVGPKKGGHWEVTRL